jgi:hypothetical protein
VMVGIFDNISFPRAMPIISTPKVCIFPYVPEHNKPHDAGKPTPGVATRHLSYPSLKKFPV